MCIENNFCVSVPYQNIGHNPLETIAAIKECNFESVFLKWYDEDWIISQFEQANYCRELGLKIEFAHLGYQNIENIWSPLKEYDLFVDRYCDDLNDLKKYDINLAVMHTGGRKQLYGINEFGLDRFKSIVEYARKLNINIAFENTSFKDDLTYILDNLLIYDNVSLCLDVGHYHIYFKDDFDLNKYKDRISCIHLHDNEGTKDQHLIPYDGSIDWSKAMKLLKDNNYSGPLTLEIIYSNYYSDRCSLIDFYTKAYKALERLKKE